MATYTKINDLIQSLAEGEMNLTSDLIGIALSIIPPGSESSDPTADGNGILANVTEIAYTNYTDDMATDRQLEGVTAATSSGVFKLDANDLTIAASGGAIADYRYIYIYNKTATTPADPLIAMVDKGSTITLADGQESAITWDASGVLTVT